MERNELQNKISQILFHAEDFLSNWRADLQDGSDPESEKELEECEKEFLELRPLIEMLPEMLEVLDACEMALSDRDAAIRKGYLQAAVNSLFPLQSRIRKLKNPE
jgi:hypothetical protein